MKIRKMNKSDISRENKKNRGGLFYAFRKIIVKLNSIMLRMRYIYEQR